MKKISITLILVSSCLIASAVFFKFLVEPIYDKYRLSGCLDRVEKNYNYMWNRECSANENRVQYSCLRGIQIKIYCRDEAHRLPSKSFWDNSNSGLLGKENYTCNAPDNSEAYWNDNSEYQQLATKCEQENTQDSCELPSDIADTFSNLRDRERNFCLKQF